MLEEWYDIFCILAGAVLAKAKLSSLLTRVLHKSSFCRALDMTQLCIKHTNICADRVKNRGRLV